MVRTDHLRYFYELLDNLSEWSGGTRRLSDCHGRLGWPERGVYFFVEEGEHRSDSGTGPRVVRVGTHALKADSRTTLWQRLSQHRGPARSGVGNHRGSIFRLLVGTALIDRYGIACPTWDNGMSAAPAEIRANERALEREVSRTIGAMRVLWLGVEDVPGPKSLRGYVERNSIALLSNHGKVPLDPPSEDWLGRHCSRPLVRTSGLWNTNHVHERYDPKVLDILQRLISQNKERS